MPVLLGYAETSDSSGAGLEVVVLAALAVVIVGGLAFVPIALVWSRRRRPSEAIAGFAVLWGIITAGVAINAFMSQQKWTHDQTSLIQSGYFDPNDVSAKPRAPWALGTGSALAYLGLIGWSLSGKKPQRAVIDQPRSRDAS